MTLFIYVVDVIQHITPLVGVSIMLMVFAGFPSMSAEQKDAVTEKALCSEETENVENL